MGISSWHLVQPGTSIPLQTAARVSKSLTHRLQTLLVALLLPLSVFPEERGQDLAGLLARGRAVGEAVEPSG